MRTQSWRCRPTGAIAIVSLSFMVGATSPVWAQGSNETGRAFAIDERFQGSSSSFGQILKLNSNLGYEISKHVGIDAGVPFYFVNYSAVGSSSNSGSKVGVGNAYTALRLSLTGPFNYTSTALELLQPVIGTKA